MPDVIRSNKRRGAAVMVVFVAVVAVFAAVIGALLGSALAFAVGGLVLGVAVALVSSRTADRVVLRVGRARPASVDDYPRLHNLVEGLCIAGGLSMPDVYVVDDEAPNAFVTGRHPDAAAIAVTTGLLDQLDRVELEGIVAHALSQIRNHDIAVSSLVATVVGAPALLADVAIRTMWWNGGRIARSGDRADRTNPVGFLGFGLLALAPIVAKAISASLPNDRITVADMSACQLTRYPPGLVSALEKLQADTTATHAASAATAHLWIAQPLSGVADDGRLAGVHRLFDTHPPLEERIALLREL